MPPALVTLAAVSAGHLGAQLIDPDGIIASLTQVLLMPVLAWFLVSTVPSTRPRLVRLTLLALGFSWLGDTLPRFASEDAGFLLMVGCFLLAQLTYAVAFLPYWRASIVRRRPILVPYAAGLARLVAVTHVRAGPLLVPLIFYGLALGTMAVLATGLGWVAGIGGALFFVSDSLIALRAFADVTLPAHGFWVMLTYLVGQTLLVLAVVRVQGGTAVRRAR